LLVQGRISACLYQCISRACPVSEHARQGHTAHLSLQQEELKACRVVEIDVQMAIKSSVRRGEDRRIWLKVKSLLDREGLGHDIESVNSDSRTSESKKRHRTGDEEIEENSDLVASQPPRRHRRSPQATNLPRIASPASDIQVCPEYLGEDDDVCHSEFMVMKMADAYTCQHYFFHLPEEERRLLHIDDREPEPYTLRKVHKDTYCQLQSMSLRWKIHVARLLVEAMIRFDRLRPPPHPEESWPSEDIIFYRQHREEGGEDNEVEVGDGLRPFLEVKIERREHADRSRSTSAAGSGGSGSGQDPRQIREWRRKLLLKLGLILAGLALGRADVDLGWVKANPKFCRDYILGMCDKIYWDVAPRYTDAVRSCCDTEWVYAEDEGGFRKKYHELVVQPLRELDT
jgi:hypothetical protein